MRSGVLFVLLLSILAAGQTLAGELYPLPDFPLGREFPLDTHPVLGPLSGGQENPSVASDGRDFLIVWDHDPFNNYGIYGTIVDSSCQVTASVIIAIDTSGNNETDPAAASDGTNYLVVYISSNDVYGRRLGPTGELLDAEPFLICGQSAKQKQVEVVFTGSHYLVVWADERNNGYLEDIYGCRVTPDGEVLEHSGIPIAIEMGDKAFPAVASGVDNCLVIWHDYLRQKMLGRRIDSSGNVLDLMPIEIAPASYRCRSSLSFDGSNYLAVWEDTSRVYYTKICGSRISSAGEVLDSPGVEIAPDMTSRWPTSIFDGTNHLVAWVCNDIVYTRRISPGGNPVDSLPVVVCSAPGSRNQASLTHSHAANFLIWRDTREYPYASGDAYGSRINAHGEILDPGGFLTTLGANVQSNPAAACNGSDYLVVWEDTRDGPDWDLYGCRYDAYGSPLDEQPIPISTAPNNQLNPVLTYDGENYLVTWEDYRDSLSAPDVYACRITASGAVLDPEGIPISITPAREEHPSVAVGDGECFIVWDHVIIIGEFNWKRQIRGARMTGDGILLDPGGIVLADGLYSAPAVSYDGENYFLFCRKLVYWDWGGDNKFDLQGVFINSDGEIITNEPLIVASDIWNLSGYPSMLFDGRHHLAAWYGAYGWVWASRIDPAGIVLDPQGFPLSQTWTYADNAYPSIAYDGTSYLAAWTVGQYNKEIIEGCRMDTSGLILSRFSCDTPSAGRSPALAIGPDKSCLMIYTRPTTVVESQPIHARRVWGLFLGPRSIVATTPQRNQINVPKETDISILFAREMDPATLTEDHLTVIGELTGYHEAFFDYDPDTHTLTIDPYYDFMPDDKITVIMKETILALDGTKIAGSYSWSFYISPTAGWGTFVPWDTLMAGSGPRSIIPADLNADGLPDLLVTNENSGTVSTLLCTGNGQFAPSTEYDVWDGAISSVVGDFDRDGDLDVAAGHNTYNCLTMLTNTGNGAYDYDTIYATGPTPHSLAVFDCDGDGDLDLASANRENSDISVLRNQNGIFAPQVSISVGDEPYSISPADIDNDGDLDLAITGPVRGLRVLTNDGKGDYSIMPRHVLDAVAETFIIFDVDGDRDLDLAIIDRTANRLLIQKNSRNGVFSLSFEIPTGDSPAGLCNGDFDFDGDLDIAVANFSSNDVSIFSNDGNGVFELKQLLPVGEQPADICAADFNGDGAIDLATANYGSNDVTVLLNERVCNCPMIGDCTGDNEIGPADVVYLINYSLRAGPAPPSVLLCPVINQGDFNCDDRINLVDIVMMINFVYLNSPIGPCDPCGM